MSAVQMGHPFRTASETITFCEHLVLVPAYRSISQRSLSLKPLTVSLALIVRFGVAAALAAAADSRPPPDLLVTSLVGTSHLNLKTHRTSIMFLAPLRGRRLKHSSLFHV